MSSHASLSAASDDRKARLAKLKSLKRKEPEPPSHDEDSYPDAHQDTTPPTQPLSTLHLSGRNYDPTTRGPKLGFEHAPNADQQTLEDQAAQLEEETRRKAAEEEATDKGIDLFKLQPKKPNWDLKRELGKKLEVLNVRTDNAIARLVRERLEAKKAVAQKKGDAQGEGEAGGLDGTELVEGLRMREREEAEEGRREREADDL